LLGLAFLLALTSSRTVSRAQSSPSGAPPIVPTTGAPTGIVTPPRSPRNASYTITVSLDPKARTLAASERIVWRNITSAATSELQFHLYWNAWKDTRSTFMRERALTPAPRRSPREGDFARLDLTALSYRPETVSGAATTPMIDLLPSIRYIAPDDGNADDRTVMAVPLPTPVRPGESVVVDLAWTARVPRPFARTGVIGDSYFLAQWFPKLGVLEEGGWNCHQFHESTEFFSDYGIYDVTIVVPSDWVVGATGAQRARTDYDNGTTSHRYYQEDVHDFAWTTSPDYLERMQRFEPISGSRPGQRDIALRLLIQPEHVGQAERHLRAARAALQRFSDWFGVYPYDQLTIVDPAFQSRADGMEYPTLITAGTSWIVPEEVTFSTPEEVVMHEAGHQFFYGIVGTNEFEHAWMDEGINTYATARAFAEEYPTSHHEQRFFRDALPWVFRGLLLRRETVWNRLPGYRRAPTSDRPSDPSFRYHPATGRLITYNKTALWLHTLERHLGWPTVQRLLSTYFERWQFKHPEPRDFFAIANEVSRQDLSWFFDQVHRSSDVFDYGVETFKSTREGQRYRTELIVRRYGEGRFPVDVAVTFGNGERVTERWDGRDRWKRYTYERDQRARTAQVDPDRVLLLDVNYTNNSRTLEGHGGEAATAWSLTWLVWLQDLLLTWAFLA